MSPYSKLDPADWSRKTKELVQEHPLELAVLLEATEAAWKQVWETTIGSGELAISLTQLAVPSQVVGYFFEKLLARQLSLLFPKDWRGGTDKAEKDLIHIPDNAYSIEVKSSGQAGMKVFGNRSYGKGADNDELASKPEKSGYYLVVNFFGTSLTNVRFGWIDHSDWKSQTSESGQAASLPGSVYKHKLVTLRGAYQMNAPLIAFRGFGPAIVAELKELGITSTGELLGYQGTQRRVLRYRGMLKSEIESSD